MAVLPPHCVYVSVPTLQARQFDLKTRVVRTFLINYCYATTDCSSESNIAIAH